MSSLRQQQKITFPPDMMGVFKPFIIVWKGDKMADKRTVYLIR